MLCANLSFQSSQNAFYGALDGVKEVRDHQCWSSKRLEESCSIGISSHDPSGRLKRVHRRLQLLGILQRGRDRHRARVQMEGLQK